MRIIACPLCRADNFSVRYPAQLEGAEDAFHYLTEAPCHYQVVVCNQCGMTYSNPIFSEERIIELYRNCRIDEAEGGSEESAIRVNMRRYLERLRADSGKQSGRLLDIGCGLGYLLAEAQALGYDAIGVDPSEQAVAHAQARFGKDSAICAAYSRELFPPQSFDLITLVHVIDHVVDPRELLDLMHYHLKPGGYAFIATHNIESMLAKFTGKGFIAWSIQHVSYFTPKTLQDMVRRSGLDPVSTRGSLTTYPLSHYAKNGIRNNWLRSATLGTLKALSLAEINLSFPFGNLEVVCRRNTD